MVAALTLSATVLASLVYLGLAAAAFQHLRPDKRKDQRDWLLAFSAYWPFYSDLYDGSEHERRLRLYGKLLVPAIVAGYIAYFMWLT